MCLGESGLVTQSIAKTYIKIKQLNESNSSNLYLFNDEHLELDERNWIKFTSQLISEIKDNLPLIPRIVFACIENQSKFLVSFEGSNLCYFTFGGSNLNQNNWVERIKHLH